MRYAKMSFGAALLAAGVLTWGSSAHAQERSYLLQQVPAPSNAFELKIGAGYTQGLGNIAPSTPIVRVAGAGIGVSADFDYRWSPAASFGLEAQYQEFTAENNTGSRGLSMNVGITTHFSPHLRGDPWFRLGTGYRLLWDVQPFGSPGTTNMFHGFDAATVKIGYDIRPTPDVAFAPVIGADLQIFVWENANALSSAQLGTFIYGGLQGRFDMLGTATGPGNVAQGH